MNGSAALLPIVIGLVMAGVFVVGFLLDRKRGERIMTYCVARGWQYVDEDPSLTDRWSGDPFGDGDRHRARNVIRGQENSRSFVAFDYSYRDHSTDSQGRPTSTTYRYAVYAIALPASLPTLEVCPEGAFMRLAGAVGLRSDIDLESEDFNRAFTVSATDRKFATDVLSPRTMQYLLSAPPAAWRIEGTDMLRWDSGRLDPANIVVATAVLGRVVDGIPAFVWKDHPAQPGYDPQP